MFKAILGVTVQDCPQETPQVIFRDFVQSSVHYDKYSQNIYYARHDAKIWDTYFPILQVIFKD